MDQKTVKLLAEIGALPGSYVGDGYARIPDWMQKDHRHAGDCIHFSPHHGSHKDAAAQPEFQEALDLIKRGFTLLATAKDRAIERIVNMEREDERALIIHDEINPLAGRNGDLRAALEGLLGAISGGDLESAKQTAYNALADQG